MIRRLLASFDVKNLKETINIYGKYHSTDIKELEDSKLVSYKGMEFSDISATHMVNGQEEVYTPMGSSWAGHKYNATDVLEFFIAAIIRGDDSHRALYIDDGLNEYIDSYTSNVAVSVAGKTIPSRIPNNKLYCVYQLYLVTDQYTYYLHDDEVLMLSTENHIVVSDNYFAEVGFWDSVNNIKQGKETLLFGELPSE